MESMDFKDIRPYTDEEIPSAMQRIAASDLFAQLAAYVFPDRNPDSVRDMIIEFKSVRDFQYGVMNAVNEQIIKRSIHSFTYNGLQHLNPHEPYLFVSNHRDIMLDASLLQYALAQQGFPTSQITFGANLMSNPLVVDIGKSNKMFRVERPGATPRAFYQSSLRNSQYIRHVICTRKESVWIAQRNGRTKDGFDTTDQGLVKMLGISMDKDKVAALASLHIVPVSVAYEWEPCDVQKALELYLSQSGPYVKKPDEDLNSILSGITRYKGDVHFEIGKPVSHKDLLAFGECSPGDFNKHTAALLDERIRRNYRLFPNNYIACDLLSKKEIHTAFYTPAQKQAFLESLRFTDRYPDYDSAILKSLFLKIYASPVSYLKTR